MSYKAKIGVEAAEYLVKKAWNDAIEQAMKIISKGSHAGVNQTQWTLTELEKLKK